MVGMNEGDFQKAILVREGENLRLRCAATGTPKPDIEWQRLDNRPISYGSWEGKDSCPKLLRYFLLFMHHLAKSSLHSFINERPHLEHNQDPADTYGYISLLCR